MANPVPAEGPMMSMTNVPPDRPRLRRAVYIHVSDLTNAYNIDHAKLEAELARVKAETTPTTTEEPKDSEPGARISPTEEESSPEIDTPSPVNVPQKRLQPPRGGFNLCVYVH